MTVTTTTQAEEAPGCRVYLHLKDELPTVGSGFRSVTLVDLGWKWVRVRPYAEPDADCARILRTVWDALKRTPPPPPRISIKPRKGQTKWSPSSAS